jgi:vancomycin resistance protein YoaR
LVAFDPHGLEAILLASEKPPRPALVRFDRGNIVRIHEVPRRVLDEAALPEVVIDALASGSPNLQLPLKTGPDQVSDADIDQIQDVVSQYSTRFSAGNRPRAWNIKTASEKLRGVIVLPGERFSFNGSVGRRTLKAGFRLAGVYKNGKHDVGIGGGICQVSTTLYNACLLADLTIRQRSNHSLPVPYVPLGRDATVDYGDLDLVVENSYRSPIAIDSHYESGRLTFRILGKKDPSLSVRITESGTESWDPGTERILDRRLKPGAHRVLEPGSRGHRVSTYRLVYHDGKLIRRERLGRSTYGGKATVVAFNPAPKPIASPPPVTGLQGQPTVLPPSQPGKPGSD